jgi:DNA repair protein RAD57
VTSLDFASSKFTSPVATVPLHLLHNRRPDHIPNASMTDLTTVLPSFSTQPYVRLLRSLESNNVTTADLISQDCAEIAKRAQLPLPEVKRLSADILDALQAALGIRDTGDASGSSGSLRKSGSDVLKSWDTISTLDDQLDQALGGGIPVGYITEVVGER